jgi:hypothetical protein
MSHNVQSSLSEVRIRYCNGLVPFYTSDIYGTAAIRWVLSTQRTVVPRIVARNINNRLEYASLSGTALVYATVLNRPENTALDNHVNAFIKRNLSHMASQAKVEGPAFMRIVDNIAHRPIRFGLTYASIAEKVHIDIYGYAAEDSYELFRSPYIYAYAPPAVFELSMHIACKNGCLKTVDAILSAVESPKYLQYWLHVLWMARENLGSVEDGYADECPSERARNDLRFEKRWGRPHSLICAGPTTSQSLTALIDSVAAHCVTLRAGLGPDFPTVED